MRWKRFAALVECGFTMSKVQSDSSVLEFRNTGHCAGAIWWPAGLCVLFWSGGRGREDGSLVGASAVDPLFAFCMAGGRGTWRTMAVERSMA